MRRVQRPSSNEMTQSPLGHGFIAYDFAGSGPDKFAHASLPGVVVESKSDEKRNWQAFTGNDPYKTTRKGKLLTADYGNYVKIRGETIFHLVSHLKPGTAAPVGTQVSAGQVIGEVGNTGNATGPHSHHEYRTLNGVKVEVDFLPADPPPVSEPTVTPEEKRAIDFLTESYKQMRYMGNFEGFTRAAVAALQEKIKAENAPKPAATPKVDVIPTPPVSTPFSSVDRFQDFLNLPLSELWERFKSKLPR